MLNGSGSYSAGDTTAGDCTAPPYCVAQAGPDAWREFRMAACDAADIEAAPGFKQSCCSFRRSVESRNNEERLLMQALSVRWCAGAIERYEARQTRRFSLVVFTRPDLVWWQPFKPWCSWPQGAVLTCESPGCDVAWAAPRAHLARLGRQHLFRRDCPNARTTRSTIVFPSCCGSPERLLSYAVRVGREALDVLAARRLKGQALLRVPEAMLAPGIGNRHMNILRSLNVCGSNNVSTNLRADVQAGRCSTTGLLVSRLVQAGPLGSDTGGSTDIGLHLAGAAPRATSRSVCSSEFCIPASNYKKCVPQATCTASTTRGCRSAL